jgi:hypothetical protein
MGWILPKTNWTEDDYINISDYSRITGNLKYLNEMYLTLGYKYVNVKIGVIDELYRDILFALNAIEDSTEYAASGTFKRPEYIGKIIQVANGRYWDFNDLNRIEGNILGLYENLTAILQQRFMLPFYLNSGFVADRMVI